MLNRLLNSTGKKIRLYVATGTPVASTEGRQAAQKPEPPAPRRKAAPEQSQAAPRSLADALGYVAECANPADGLAVLEASGLSAQRAAIMGGISMAAYAALHGMDGSAPEWLAFRQSVAEWRDRLAHADTP